jgi:hypothetical protein
VRALATLNFINAAYDFPDWYYNQADVAEAEAAGELFYGQSWNASYTISRQLWDAANAEARQVAKNLGGSLVNFDTPGPPIGRKEIGVICLLFKRGVDTILVFRDTATDGDVANIEAWVGPAFIDESAPLGMAQLMKKQWIAAGLEWGAQQEKLASSSSIVQRLLVQVRASRKRNGRSSTPTFPVCCS